MGIKSLKKLLADHAPAAIKVWAPKKRKRNGRGVCGAVLNHSQESVLTAYFGRKIAIDASMFLYSFLVAIRRDDSFVLTDAQGETTRCGSSSQCRANECSWPISHLQGVFNRTVRLLECGIKPVYVFDGKPPTMKGGEVRHLRTLRRVQFALD